MEIEQDRLLLFIESNLNNKLFSCLSHGLEKKPFNHIYEEVRPRTKKIKTTEKNLYLEAIKKFLDENPEFLKKNEE